MRLKGRMNHSTASRLFRLGGLLFALTPGLFSQSIRIDHTCTDVSLIPDAWIDQVKSRIKLHYAHTSHGGQLTAGLGRLADPARPAYDVRLKYKLEFRSLPSGPDLCILDGQLLETYITPELYWKNGGDALTRDVLETFKPINVSLWAWCTQMDYYSESEVETYLNSISNLERSYPQIKFVYMTGNAQATGASGYNRHLRNEQIRRFCRENNKILFDFADLDAWYNNEEATYDYNGRRIPREHPFYHGDEAGHTTFLSCETKAKALWLMLARIAGWDGGVDSSDCDCNKDGIVDENDLAIKREQLMAQFKSENRTKRKLSKEVDGTIDSLERESIQRWSIILQEIWNWIRRCGIRN